MRCQWKRRHQTRNYYLSTQQHMPRTVHFVLAAWILTYFMWAIFYMRCSTIETWDQHLCPDNVMLRFKAPVGGLCEDLGGQTAVQRPFWQSAMSELGSRTKTNPVPRAAVCCSWILWPEKRANCFVMIMHFLFYFEPGKIKANTKYGNKMCW